MTSKKVGTFVTPWGVTVHAMFRPNTNDWNTLTSCLVEDEYRTKDLPPGIRLDGTNLNAVDIGGHIGGCTLALLSRGYKVITVEPLPENMEMITRSVGLNGWDARWYPVRGAISGASGNKMAIAYGDTSTEAGSHHEFVGVGVGVHSATQVSGTRTVDVRTVSIGELVEMCDDRAGWIEAPMKPPFSDGRIEFLKIDCEGGEWDAFSTVHPSNLAKIKLIAAELHPISSSVDIRAEFWALLDNQFDDITDTVYSYTLGYDKLTTTNAYYQHK